MMMLRGLGAIRCPAGYGISAILEKDTGGNNVVTGLPFTEAEKTGYACVNELGIRLEQMSDPEIAGAAAGHIAERKMAYVLFAGAAAIILLAPGWAKLLAAPVALVGVEKSMAGVGF